MGKKRSTKSHRKSTRSRHLPGIHGTIQLGDHDAYVETAEGTFPLTGKSRREVMADDEVLVSIHHAARGERRATVHRVIRHATDELVGIYEEAGPLGVIRPLDQRIRADFFILPSDTSAEACGVASGDVVRARILSYPAYHESGVATITVRLGDTQGPELGIWCVMARYDLKDGYPDGPLRTAETINLGIDDALQDPLRRDIRDRFVITIDPVDARDFDDAISVTRHADGGWELGVHIADVSHYVSWGDSIDLEARRRGTSVYLSDRVLPMLPERLSNKLCSLVAHEDRLAMTVDVKLSAEGTIEQARMYPSVIHSNARLSYEQAEAILCGMPIDKANNIAIPHGGAALSKQLTELSRQGLDLPALLRDAHELAKVRKCIRKARGAIDFDIVEIHPLLDRDGEPTKLTVRKKTPATELIEEAMLIANECVAAKLARVGIATAFRVHEAPSLDRLHEAAQTLHDLGAIDLKLAQGIAVGEQHAMQKALAKAAGTQYAEIVNALLLRAQQRAVYRAHNQGHYALGAEAYCHFTSPIRRYPDLMVHRTLKDVLAREQLGRYEANLRAPHLVGEGAESLSAQASVLCRMASDAERVADAAAHASQKVHVARYYQSRIGERAAGTVSWMSNVGIFVRLDETAAEGMIPFRTLGNEWFDFDEQALCATGSATGRTIAVGNRVIVEIAAADPIRGHLDFKLIHRNTTLH